jgi:glycosyltransferase involved in cell wall biosynthesis
MEDFYAPLRKRLLYPFLYVYDLFRLAILFFRKKNIKIIQVNPSLIPVPLVRDALVVLMAKMLNKKVVVLFHGWKEHMLLLFKRHALMRMLFKWVYQRASVTVVLASRFKEDLVAMGWQPDDIQVTSTMFDRNEIVSPENRAGQKIRFLYLGRISALKGVGEIIDAARLMAEQGVDFKFIIVGHGDRPGVAEDYEKRVKAYGLENRFCFTGRLTGEDKFRAYAQSDVYVFPSWTEGCPTSVLEALGAGLFVISTDVGALRDIIRENENGRFVRRKDCRHLADVMAWACKNIDNIRKKRPAIAQEAAKRFEAGVIVEQFDSIYTRLLNG